MATKEKTAKKTAKTIVKKIIEDLTGRSGLGNEWEAMDGEIRREIKEQWRAIVVEELTKE